MMENKVIIVQGGQWGSEAKGAIAAYLCKTEKVDTAVRTGATNAGHTVYYLGSPIKMQQLPTGWVNPSTDLVLGAGALIDPAILDRECAMVTELTGVDVRKRLFIDHRAGIHLPVHQERSAASGRHHAIGATGKGCSEALIDKIRGRGSNYQLFGDSKYAGGYNVVDTAVALNDQYDSGAKILLEGTQGTLLDLHLGPYPFTTHKQTTPAVWLAECGLSPALPLDIVLVVRTYPIRVAGNSGPMPGETTWPVLARRINDKRAKLGLPPIVSEEALAEFEYALRSVTYDTEFESDEARASESNKLALARLDSTTLSDLCQLFELTTVTQKLRRVANMSWNTLGRAARLVRPHRVALTFMNYEFPQHWYELPNPLRFRNMPLMDDRMAAYIRAVEIATRAPVTMATFGPADEHVFQCS